MSAAAGAGGVAAWAPDAADPYPAYAAQRADGPLAARDEIAIATGHREVRALLADPRCGCARVPPAADLGGGDPARGEPLRRTIERMAVLSDAPRHARVRRPLQRAFAPRVVAAWRGRIRELAEAQLDRAEGDAGRKPERRGGEAARGLCAVPAGGVAEVGAREHAHAGVEVVGALSDPLLGAVLDGLLGLPAGAGAGMRATWRVASASIDDPEHGLAPDAPLRLLDLHEQLALLLKRARAQGGELPIHRYARAAAEAPELTEHELVANLLFVVTSGHRSGSQALALAIHALACHPDQLARLNADPGLVAGAVEELLRWDGPVQSTSRVLREDVELGGCTLRAGELAMLVLGAANRDPSAFAAAERLDVGAHAAGHLSFGYGPHFCVGAALMRIVLQEALGALARRAARLELAEPPRWTASRRGFERLVVRW